MTDPWSQPIDCIRNDAFPAHTSAQSEDGNQAYSTGGSTHSIPTSAPGMYRCNNNQGSNAPYGAPSMVSNASLESHMTKKSKTMLELAQAHQEIVNTQNKIIKLW